MTTTSSTTERSTDGEPPGSARTRRWPMDPAMNDYVLDHRGTRHDAAVVDTSTHGTKHGDGRTCTVVPTDTAERLSYDVDGTQGCADGLTRGSRVTLVVDPAGWPAPRLGSEVKGAAPSPVWTSAGLFTGMEAFILCGRLRRRP